MRKSRFTTEQIIGFIKQAEAGMAVSGLFRVSRGVPAWCWVASAGIGGCRPTVLGGVGFLGCG
ncbi:hypothetical protein ABQE52_21345, partial [Mycolicibacterium thermoresistibile]